MRTFTVRPFRRVQQPFLARSAKPDRKRRTAQQNSNNRSYVSGVLAGLIVKLTLLDSSLGAQNDFPAITLIYEYTHDPSSRLRAIQTLETLLDNHIAEIKHAH